MFSSASRYFQMVEECDGKTANELSTRFRQLNQLVHCTDGRVSLDPEIYVAHNWESVIRKQNIEEVTSQLVNNTFN